MGAAGSQQQKKIIKSSSEVIAKVSS